MARTYKTRHQLFLPEDMSKRLAHIAEASGKARSETGRGAGCLVHAASGTEDR